MMLSCPSRGKDCERKALKGKDLWHFGATSRRQGLYWGREQSILGLCAPSESPAGLVLGTITLDRVVTCVRGTVALGRPTVEADFSVGKR